MDSHEIKVVHLSPASPEIIKPQADSHFDSPVCNTAQICRCEQGLAPLNVGKLSIFAPDVTIHSILHSFTIKSCAMAPLLPWEAFHQMAEYKTVASGMVRCFLDALIFGILTLKKPF